jgi:hypothetical protein
MTERLLLIHPRTGRIETPRDLHVLRSVHAVPNYLTVLRDLAICMSRIVIDVSDANEAYYRLSNSLALRCEPLYGCANSGCVLPNITMKLPPRD